MFGRKEMKFAYAILLFDIINIKQDLTENPPTIPHFYTLREGLRNNTTNQSILK